MSNDEGSLEQQKRRHAGPLIGMAAVVIAALAGLFWWLSYEVSESTAPVGADQQIDGRTGETTEPAPDVVPGAASGAAEDVVPAAPAEPTSP